MGDVLLRASGLTKAFGGQVVLDGVGLTLRRGDVVLLEGENGSGKTTLLNILSGCLMPDCGSIDFLANGHPRRFSFPQPWWQALRPVGHFSPEAAAASGIGRTWQDVRLFGSQTLRENIAVGVSGHPGENPVLAVLAASRVQAFERTVVDQADEDLARFQLGDRAASSADKVSLGQAKRVAIARAVQAGARVLFLDEPLAGLDTDGIASVVALLRDLVRSSAMTFVIVEHILNQPFLANLVQTQWELAGGRLRESTGRAGVTLDPDQTAFWTEALGDGARVAIDKLPRGALLVRLTPQYPPPPSATGLDIRGLVVGRGPRPVVGIDESGEATGLDLRIAAGETALLLAPNGWGKTTLADAMGARLPVARGSIAVPAAGLHYIPADATLFPNLTCEEFLQLGGMNGRLALADLNGFAGRRIGSLSGGERKRLQLLLLDRVPDGAVVVMDEPLTSLDGQHADDLLMKLRTRRGRVTFLLLAPKHS